jgi:hypothetical protein
VSLSGRVILLKRSGHTSMVKGHAAFSAAALTHFCHLGLEFDQYVFVFNLYLI